MVSAGLFHHLFACGQLVLPKPLLRGGTASESRGGFRLRLLWEQGAAQQAKSKENSASSETKHAFMISYDPLFHY